MLEKCKRVVNSLGRSMWHYVEQHPYISGVILVVLILA